MTALSFTDGWRWFLDACRALRAQPLALTSLVIFYILVLGVASSLPIFGMLIAAIFMPFGSVMIAQGACDALNGRRPVYTTLLVLWRDTRIRQHLFGLGLIYAVVLEIISLIFSLLAKAEIAAWQIKDGELLLDSVLNNIPWTGIIVALILYIPTLLAFWFSPLLVAYKGQTMGKSLFYSFFGTLKALVPLIVMSILLLSLSAFVVTLMELLGVALGGGTYIPFLGTIVMPFLATVMYATVWPVYRDLFEQTNFAR